MSSPDELTAQVRTRAKDRCEYCRMHQSLQGATFHVEHVVPESKGGPTELANLALACPSCNLHKSNRTQITNPASGEVVAFFNPRQDSWADHFSWRGYFIEGLTPIGRATIEAWHLNAERRVSIRQAEEMFALFPP